MHSGHFCCSPSKEEERIRTTSSHPSATGKQPQSYEKILLRKDKQSTWHCSFKWDNICVFKNKANIIKEALLFYVEKCKSQVAIGSGEAIHWPVVKDPRSWSGSEFHYYPRDLSGLLCFLKTFLLPKILHKEIVPFPHCLETAWRLKPPPLWLLMDDFFFSEENYFFLIK